MNAILARRQLRLAVVVALNNLNTIDFQGLIDSVGLIDSLPFAVDTPGDWSSDPAELPAILVRNSRERKESIGKGMPTFNTQVTLELEARIEATNEVAAQDNIEAMVYLIEMAILQDYGVIQIIQQVVSIDSEIQVTSEGKKHLGGVKISMVFEMFEAFEPSDDWLPQLKNVQLVNPLDKTGFNGGESSLDLKLHLDFIDDLPLIDTVGEIDSV